MTYDEALTYLNSIANSKWKLGLEREKELLARLGNPQKGLRFVHIAGTNGKGSTCAMTEKILRDAGYRTGLFPSPYIEKFNERIQICGQMISDDDIARLTETVKREADAMEDRPTHFELVTAIGLLYFAEQKCDIVVLEVGLGGRFDATNVIDPPEVAAICNIGLDHTDWLGDTVEKIAFEKCGIIKSGSAVVAYDNICPVMKVIEENAGACGDRIYYAKDVEAEFSYAGMADAENAAETEEMKAGTTDRENAGAMSYELSLFGHHQKENAKVVLSIIAALRDRGWKIQEEAVRSGLATTEWPARFEILYSSKRGGKFHKESKQSGKFHKESKQGGELNKPQYFILDGGHNPQCAQAMVNALEELSGEQTAGTKSKVIFLMGMLRDKDYLDTIDIIAPYAKEFITLTPDSPRALPAEELASAIRAKGFKATAAGEIAAGNPDETEIAAAIKVAMATGETVVAFGSLYMAGAIRKEFRELHQGE